MDDIETETDRDSPKGVETETESLPIHWTENLGNFSLETETRPRLSSFTVPSPRGRTTRVNVIYTQDIKIVFESSIRL